MPGVESLFFDYAPIHVEAARHRRIVPFADTVILVLGPVEPAAFKAVYDRTRDWADIEDMVRADSLDTVALRRLLDGECWIRATSASCGWPTPSRGRGPRDDGRGPRGQWRRTVR